MDDYDHFCRKRTKGPLRWDTVPADHFKDTLYYMKSTIPDAHSRTTDVAYVQFVRSHMKWCGAYVLYTDGGASRAVVVPPEYDKPEDAQAAIEALFRMQVE